MKLVQRSIYLFACVAVAGIAHAAQAAGTTDAPNIVSLQAQQCEGPAMVRWVVHSRREEFQAQGWMPFGDTGYRIDFARLGRFREWTVAERLHDVSRKVDDSYALISPSGLGPYHAAFVVTRMPTGEEMSDEALMQTAISLQHSNAGDRAPSFIAAETPFGNGIEMVVGGRVGSFCFPTSPFAYASEPENASIGISRFVVHNGALVEYALVLRWPQGVSEGEMISKAQAEMDVLESALTVAPQP